VREAVRNPAPSRIRPIRVAVDPSVARSHLIEAFYIAEAKAQLGRQASATSNQRRTR
jgi:hypothetical protein